MTDVQALIDEVKSYASKGHPFELWVPDVVEIQGSPAPPAIVMAIVGDTVLGEGYWPDGFEESDGGRRYRYKIME